jgi:hypothetical protein
LHFALARLAWHDGDRAEARRRAEQALVAHEAGFPADRELAEVRSWLAEHPS